jgi:hypothetical protein
MSFKEIYCPINKVDARNVRKQKAYIGIENRNVSGSIEKCHFWCPRRAGKRREE